MIRFLAGSAGTTAAFAGLIARRTSGRHALLMCLRHAVCTLAAMASVAAAGTLAAAEQAKPAGQHITVELKKAGDRAEAGKTKEGALVAIHSESGIGGAKLIRPAGGWPRSVIIRIDVKGMESVRLEGGGLWSESFLGGELRRPYWKTGQIGNTEATAAGRLDFAVTRFKGGVQIEVPKELLNTNAAVISLQWVDFFR